MTGIVDSVDISVEVWGGLVSDLAAADLPHGASPDCQDCAFEIGSVRTRPGITSLYSINDSPFGIPAINYMKTYFNLQEVPRFLSFDNLGFLRKDITPGGALTVIASDISPSAYAKSDSLFAREYIAFGDGENGLDIPRQYDDTNFDRISQVGPGQAPSAYDENIAATNLTASPGGLLVATTPYGVLPILSIVQTGYLAVVTVSGGSFAASKANDILYISGSSVPDYDGTWVISQVLSNTQISYVLATTGLANAGASGNASTNIVEAIPTGPVAAVVGQLVNISGATNADFDGSQLEIRAVTDSTHLWVYIPTVMALDSSSGGGTIQPGGSIDAGKHGVSVIFVTRNGYYTKPAPPTYWNASGNQRVILTGIPIASSNNVIARIVCFTAANQASFYHLQPPGLTIFSSNMVISDNTTTTLTVDFTDQVLLLGTLDDPLFNQIELPPVAGILGYSNRLFAWGEQNNNQGFLNLSFDGGFSNLTSATTGNGNPNFPLGWTPDAANSAGGGSANVGGYPSIFGDAYTITGDGATAIRGKIAQSAAVDYLGTSILQPNTAYGVQARLTVQGVAPIAGAIHINLHSASGGYTTPGWAIGFGSVGPLRTIVAQTLTTGLATIPTDLVLQVYVDGTPTNGSVFVLDNIEIYPLNQQYNNSNLRASFGQLATQGQESFDSQTGLIQYNLNDGQSLRTCFKIRERLYLVKEHSFGVTQDDTVSEPSFWAVNDVSKAVGTPSVNGVGIGEDWVVIAHRTGLYLYWGGEVLKISQEIQPTWDTINWQYGYTISVTVDTRKRRILICAPFGNATVPNKTLVLDYHDVGSDASAIASNPPIHLTYTGTKKAFDRARKWTTWTIAANSIAQIELIDGTTAIYFGSNDGTGNINVLDTTGTVLTDNGNVIPSYYVTAAFAELPTEDAKQLRSHRHLYTYLSMYAQGSGLLGVTVYPDSLSNGIALNPLTLSNPAFKDLEMMLNESTERMFFKFNSSGVGQWFDLQRAVINMKPEPWSIIRGAP